MLYIKQFAFSLLLVLFYTVNGTGQDTVIFNVGSDSGEVGDIVCIDVTVEEFDSVAALQWFLRLDLYLLMCLHQE